MFNEDADLDYLTPADYTTYGMCENCSHLSILDRGLCDLCAAREDVDTFLSHQEYSDEDRMDDVIDEQAKELLFGGLDCE